MPRLRDDAAPRTCSLQFAAFMYAAVTQRLVNEWVWPCNCRFHKGQRAVRRSRGHDWLCSQPGAYFVWWTGDLMLGACGCMRHLCNDTCDTAPCRMQHAQTLGILQCHRWASTSRMARDLWASWVRPQSNLVDMHMLCMLVISYRSCGRAASERCGCCCHQASQCRRTPTPLALPSLAGSCSSLRQPSVPATSLAR